MADPMLVQAGISLFKTYKPFDYILTKATPRNENGNTENIVLIAAFGGPLLR